MCNNLPFSSIDCAPICRSQFQSPDTIAIRVDWCTLHPDLASYFLWIMIYYDFSFSWIARNIAVLHLPAMPIKADDKVAGNEVYSHCFWGGRSEWPFHLALLMLLGVLGFYFVGFLHLLLRVSWLTSLIVVTATYLLLRRSSELF